MKVVKEIGFKKGLKFFFYSLFQLFYPLLVFPQLRQWILIFLGSKIGNNSIIMNVRFFNWYHKGAKGLKIGNNCFIGDETLIDLYDNVVLEDHVTVAQRVTILTHLNVGYKDHPLQKYFPKKSKAVKLETGSVVGAGAIILSGITVGKKSFVAAGSVVTKNVPQNSLFGGNPARLIRKIK